MELTDGRLSLAVLSACAALVLGAGGAWWVAADPERGAAPTPTLAPVVVPEEEVAPEPPQEDLESYLPVFPNTVTRHVGRIESQDTFVMHVPTQKEGEYRLQYVCLGPGELSVRIQRTTEGEMLYDADCGGNLSTFQFRAAGPDAVIEVYRPDSLAADIGIQVIDVE